MSDTRSTAPAASGLGARVFRMLDERFQISGLVTFLGHQEVPVGSQSMLWY